MHKKHSIFMVVAVSVTAFIGVFTFVQNREKVRLQTEIAELDKQIKLLQLHDKLEHRTSKV